MKMEHISGVPIPEGTLQMAIIAKGFKDNEVFAYKAFFDDELIETFKFIEDNRIETLNAGLDPDDECLELSPKGKAALEAIETSFYSPMNKKGEN